MLYIRKMRADCTVDFAAEELKKYLRMLMPEGGDVRISYGPDATDGFRLGLLEDFGLPFEGEDPFYDDVIHIDTDEKGGILAGSNPRSVLFAVYRFLKLNGCRWLFPGIDGEHIPIRDITPQRYHKLADHRIRAHCNEGAEIQYDMMEFIDFYPKHECNAYMLEFLNPFCYYDTYYRHVYNEKNRPPEPVTADQTLQWKRACEAEIAKRGSIFVDMGHGFTYYPFGLDPTVPWPEQVKNGATIDPEMQELLALIDGQRGVWHGRIIDTNICMSNPKARKQYIDYAVNYAKKHENVDILSLGLADGRRNHCTCENCLKKTPSDWLIVLLNEMDEALTAQGMDTRCTFSLYVDTYFPPVTERIKNPRRFVMKYCPISRSYSRSITADTVYPEPQKFVHNGWKDAQTVEEAVALLKQWQQVWTGPAFGYEYHFWRHQYYDPGHMALARRLYEDVLGLRYQNLMGYMEDGSERSFFPHGFAMYIYDETLMHRDLDYEAVKEDYFSHLYGPDWRDAVEYFDDISATFDHSWMQGEKSVDPTISKFYDPAAAQRLRKVRDLAARGRALAAKHRQMPTRPQTVAWQLMAHHADYCEGLSAVMIEKALGNNDLAYQMLFEFFEAFGKREQAIERFYDHYLCCEALDVPLRVPKKKR